MSYLQEEEYEYEDDEKPTGGEDEEERFSTKDIEDPKVIKELIDLIKKVGGLEELEKQIKFHDDKAILTDLNTKEVSTTPATISKSLYEKVLSRTSAGTFAPKSRFSQLFNRKVERNQVDRSETEVEEKVVTRQNSDNKYSSVIRNSRPSAQNEGLDKLSELDGGLIKERPKYVTINRTRPTQPFNGNDEEIEKENLEDEEEDDDEEEISQNQRNRYNTTPQPQYVTIRRRPTTQSATNNNNDDDEEEDDEEEIIANHRPTYQSNTQGPQYSSIQRRRPTTSVTEESETVESITPSISYSSVTTNRYVYHRFYYYFLFSFN